MKQIFKEKLIYLSATATAPQGLLTQIQTTQNDPLFSPLSTAKHLIDLLIEGMVKYSFQVLGGLIILILGWILAGFVTKFISKFLHKRQIDVTVTKFLVGGVKLAIFTFAGIIALGKFGIEIAPLIAGLSVAGVGISLALQGLLSNYAAGISLIFTKPFKVGDIIEVAGVLGEVEDMTLPRTLLRTMDNTVIVVPNKHIIGEIIHNFSEFKKIDLKVGVAYDSDVDKAVIIMKRLIAKDERILQSKQIQVGISEFADSSITLTGRIWCKQAHYWDTVFDLNKKILDEFRKNQITIPFPQRTVHIVKD